MDGDAGGVDASVPELVLNSAFPDVADFGELLRPVFEVRQALAELSLEADDEGPAEGVDSVAMDNRAAVGAGLDFVLGNIREGDAGDPLVALRQGVTVVLLSVEN